jgi:hypothetical protein
MAAKWIQTQTSIADAVAQAYCTADELRGELQEWYDNLPENFQNGSKGEQLTEAIDALSDVADYETEAPEVLGDCEVPDPRPTRRSSRAARRDEAEHYLRAAGEAAQEYLDEQQEEHDAWVAAQALPRTVTSEQEEQERAQSLDRLAADVEEFIGLMEEHADALSSVEFPGMFG